MFYVNSPPKEGDIYKIVSIDEHTFELRYGYYEEFERGGDPVVLYPDLEARPLYTREGKRIVSAIQNVCGHYLHPVGRTPENCCYTCSHYQNKKEDISICGCEKQRREPSKESGA